jgi:UDP-N-acetylglucosamine 2-epimerase
MGEDPKTILAIGCPSSDIARQLDRNVSTLADAINTMGAGGVIDVTRPFLLVVYHPTTTEYGDEAAQMEELLKALQKLEMQAVLMWPNIDAGADHISKTIRVFRDHFKPRWLRALTNLSPDDYLKVLCNAACAVGNSSSFVRDASYFGTPVVLVGSRQKGREVDQHVLTIPVVAEEIVASVRRQLAHGRYPMSSLYGDGNVAARIAESLASLNPYVQKRLHYIFDGTGMPDRLASPGEMLGSGKIEETVE